MKAYIITSKVLNTDRFLMRKELEKGLKDLGHDVELYCGPDVRILKDNWTKHCPDFEDMNGWMSGARGPGTICCAQAHLNLWRKIVEQPSSAPAQSLIFEDDAVILDKDHLKECIETVPRTHYWSILHRTCLDEGHHQLNENAPEAAGGTWILSVPVHTVVSCAYIIHNRGAEYLSRFYPPIKYAPDHYMQHCSGRKETYTPAVAPINHNRVGGTSHIGNTWKEGNVNPFVR